MKRFTLFFLLSITYISIYAQDKADEKANAIIRKHGMDQSKVMQFASKIVDELGPRLTGSDMLDNAGDFVILETKKMGFQNVHKEQWGPFGRGWELKHFEMHAESPAYFPIIAYPKAWSPSSNGHVTGEVIYLNAATEEELAVYKGKLAGKFVLLDTIREVKEWFDPSGTRFTSDQLLNMANSPMPGANTGRGNLPRNFGQGNRSTRALWDLIYNEKPLAVLDRSFKGDLGTVFVSGARAKSGSAYAANAEVVPQVTLAVEHYNRIFRMVHSGKSVKLSFDLKSSYSNPDGMENNFFAEIPGSGELKDEVVMFGAHFDSWHSGTGATDNGAGSCVMLEVARILSETYKELGIQPKRTLRLALWTGEEQGLLGSRAYVSQKLVVRDTGNNIKALKHEHAKVSAYYNLDNGTGKVRGIYLQGNDKLYNTFRTWLDPWKDLGATTLTMQNTGGTDHLAFDAVGIPGFQFIQDEISYSSKTHHSNMDNFDHLIEADLKQAATVIASFVYHTAQRDEKLPRKTQPNVEVEK